MSKTHYDRPSDEEIARATFERDFEVCGSSDPTHYILTRREQNSKSESDNQKGGDYYENNKTRIR